MATFIVDTLFSYAGEPLQPFASWPVVISAAKSNVRIWYKPPLDLRASILTVLKVYKNGKLRCLGGDCTFTADAGHLSRCFYVPQPDLSPDERRTDARLRRRGH